MCLSKRHANDPALASRNATFQRIPSIWPVLVQGWNNFFSPAETVGKQSGNASEAAGGHSVEDLN